MSDLHPLSGAYAVDALDDLERARFEKHLAECPDCADEVRSLQEAASMLALAVDPTPFDLRSRVLAEISTVRPLPPQRQTPPAEVVRRTTKRFPRLVAGIAAALVLITGGGVVASQFSHVDEPVSQQVMQAADSRTQAVSFADGSTATLYHSKSIGRAVLVTKKMAGAPKGKAYELWFQAQDGTFVPAGLMTSGGNQTVVLHGKLGTAKGVGITVEPASGSTSPSSVPFAMFNLAKSV